MDALPPDKLLNFLAPSEIDHCNDEELLYLVKQVALTPESTFPVHQRIHERAHYLRQVIATKEAQRNEKKEWDKWSAEMLQSIHIHNEQMEHAKAQLENQKKASRSAMVISIIAALAAIASALIAFFQMRSGLNTP